MTGMKICKDGVTVSICGNTVICDNGERYTLSGGAVIGPLTGHLLHGPHGVIGNHVKDINEAFRRVVAIHGGSRD